MRKILALVLFSATCGALLAAEDSKESEQFRKAVNVLNEVMQTPDRGIPNELFESAVCVGIVPSEIKFAFGIGGTYGRGILVCRKGGNGSWGPPSMFTLGGGSFGFQIGGKETDVVFLVRSLE